MKRIVLFLSLLSILPFCTGPREKIAECKVSAVIWGDTTLLELNHEEPFIDENSVGLSPKIYMFHCNLGDSIRIYSKSPYIDAVVWIVKGSDTLPLFSCPEIDQDDTCILDTTLIVE